jgi:hypothetical protein
MKDIKDYLHLYINSCECEVIYVNTQVKNHIAKVGETVKFDDVTYYVVSSEDIINIKLILRPLSDMTEGEAWEFVGGKSDHLYDDLKIDKIDKTGISISYVINAGDEGSFPQSHKFDFFALGPEQFRHLLSRGFDLFNLIPEGLAIDKRTIEKPEVSKEH